MNARKPLDSGVCQHCGATFQRRHGKTKMLFCSRECYIKGRLQGDKTNHPGWKGGITQRSSAEKAMVRAIVREVAHCQRCAATEKLHGHHVESHASAPERRLDPSNIMVLCAPCHALEHPEIHNLVTRPQIRTGKAFVCLVCGKPSYKQPFEFAVAKYCSRKCTNIGRTIVPSGKEIACAVCGKLRYVSPVHFAKAKFCSLECSGKSRQGDRTRGLSRSGAEIACNICGKARYVNQAMLSQAKYCSRTCASAARRVARV